MKKQAFSKLLFILLLFSLFSCSFNKKPSETKVYIVAVGLCYEGQNFLQSPVSDVVEFTEYYRNILDAKNIDYEVYYMLDYASKKPLTSYAYIIENESDITSPYYPTIDNLNAVLSEIKEKSTSKDLLVFLYSGHGAETSLKDEVTGDIVYDADDNGALCLRTVTDRGTEKILSPSIATLNLPVLVETLKEMPLTKTVIMDSCFSGSLIGSLLDGEVVGESIGSKGESYVGQENFYKIAFDRLDEVTNFAAVTASRASETSSEVGSLYQDDDSLFNGERHGLLFGSVISGLGLTHSKTNIFSIVPSSTSENTKIHSSLLNEFEVQGMLPKIAFMESLEFSTNEIFKIARKANKNYNDVYGTTQLTQQHFGPVGIKLAW